MAACAAAIGCSQRRQAGADRRRGEGVSRQRQRDHAEARDRSRARPAGCSRTSSPTTPKRSRRAPTRRPTKPARRSPRRRCSSTRCRLPADERRQLNLLKVVAGPRDAVRPEGVRRAVEDHGAARVDLRQGQVVHRPGEAGHLHEHRRGDADPGDAARREALREAWEGWHTISPPMRKDYQRFVELSNKGAKELGFADTGAMWRSKYDMPPDEFTKELDRLWDQVRPLYLKLHAYVRMKLREKYGDVVPENGPIPAHLLGNIWAQDWSNIYPLVAPPQRRPRLLADRHPEEAQDAGARHGPHRRALLHFARLRAAAARPSGSARCSSGRATARSSATPARGTSTTTTTCASRCASSRRPKTSRPSTTSSATTSTSAPTRISRCCSATAPTTASTKRSATPSRCRSRRSTWSRSACSTRRPTPRATSAC